MNAIDRNYVCVCMGQEQESALPAPLYAPQTLDGMLRWASNKSKTVDLVFALESFFSHPTVQNAEEEEQL